MDFDPEPTSVVLLPWRKPDPLSPPANQVKAAFADRYLNHLELLNLNSSTRTVNLTNIMATVGVKNNSVPLIKELLTSGANILRIPTHSCKLHELKHIVKNVKTAIQEISLKECMPVTCALAVETQGTQIRTGHLSRPDSVGEGDKDYSVQLAQDANMILTSDPIFQSKSSAKRLFVSSPELANRVLIDDVIFLDGRNIHLKVVEKELNDIHCTVMKAGKLRDDLLVTARQMTLNLPILTEQDENVIEIVLNENLDIIIVSTLRDSEPIRMIREKLQDGTEKVLIVAKIETLVSMEYIDDIITEADGVLLDRIHLAAATSVDDTFLIQKIVAARCNKQGKPFIVSGNILLNDTIESYEEVSVADMNDVNSLVQDGADVLVLSQSKHQHSRVDILKNMLKKAESVLWEKQIYEDLTSLAYPPLDPAHSIAIACVNTALKCQAAAIIVVTCSGYSAKLIAKYRPQCPIIAVASLGYVCRHLNLHRNIKPLHFIRKPQADWSKDVDCRIQFAIQHGMELEMICPGDPLVLINGWRRGAGFTNIMRVVYAPIETVT